MTGHISCCSAVLIQPAVDAVAPDCTSSSPAPDRQSDRFGNQKTKIFELLPEAFVTCICALLGQLDCECLVKSPIDALDGDSSF